MATPEEIGARIRAAREAAGLSQGELGASLEPPRSHAAVSDMERGVSRVGAVEISQLARILNQTTGYFYGETRTEAFFARGDSSDNPESRKAIKDFKDFVRKMADKEEKSE